jgi:hypothetical protein
MARVEPVQNFHFLVIFAASIACHCILLGLSALPRFNGCTCLFPDLSTMPQSGETSGRKGAPCSAATKRLGRLAMIKGQDSAEASSQPVLLGLASAANGRLDSSNPILHTKGPVVHKVN